MYVRIPNTFFLFTDYLRGIEINDCKAKIFISVVCLQTTYEELKYIEIDGDKHNAL